VTSAMQKVQLNVLEKFGRVNANESVPRVFTTELLAARRLNVLESGSGLKEFGRRDKLDPVSTRNEIVEVGKDDEDAATRNNPNDGVMPSISAAKRDGIRCFLVPENLTRLCQA